MAGGEEAFAEVAGDNFFRIADGSQIHAGVPSEEYIDVCRYMTKQVFDAWSCIFGGAKKWRQKFGETGGIHVATGCFCDGRFFW